MNIAAFVCLSINLLLVTAAADDGVCACLQDPPKKVCTTQDELVACVF